MAINQRFLILMAIVCMVLVAISSFFYASTQLSSTYPLSLPFAYSQSPHINIEKLQQAYPSMPILSPEDIDLETYEQLIFNMLSSSQFTSSNKEVRESNQAIFSKLIMLQEKAMSLMSMSPYPSLDNQTQEGVSSFRPQHPQTSKGNKGSLFLGHSHALNTQYPSWRLHEDGSLKKYAYVTLIGGVKRNTKGHFGFLVNAAVNAWMLRMRESIADVIVLVDFADDSTSLPKEQEDLLKEQGIKIVYLDSWGKYQANFVTVEFQKCKIWNMVEYDVVIFFDGDVMMHGTLDPFFASKHDLFLRGRSEPLNAGLMVVHPDATFYKEKMLPWIEWRLEHSMSAARGWGEKYPIEGYPIRGEGLKGGWKQGGDWHSMVSGPAVQGLMYLLYEIEFKEHSVIDIHKLTYWDHEGNVHPGDNRVAEDPALISLATSIGQDPILTPFYSHFTAKKKPWMKEAIRTIAAHHDWKILWWAWRCERVGVSFQELTSQNIVQLGFFANHQKLRSQP